MAAPTDAPGLTEAIQLDTELVELVRPIQVLRHLVWPRELEARFLDRWRSGNPALPEVSYTPPDHRSRIESLERLMERCDTGHELGRFLQDTAWSYATAARMIQGSGTPDFVAHALRLYGPPNQSYATQSFGGLEAAETLLRSCDELLDGGQIDLPPQTLDSETFANRMSRDVDAFFTRDKVQVVIDPTLTAKAIAGATRIRVRGGATFSELDYHQLLHHEAYVHCATALNGRHQPYLRSLGLSSPRTTRTQEGIAVLAELLTLSLDLQRLRRVALRVRAADAALKGADFIQVFEIFLEADQSETDSYRSTQRIFRGGDVRGRVVFPKDAVYLKGLIEVDAFLKVAIRENRPQSVARLFAGRLTLGDVVSLDPLFDSGFLAGPVYTPPWAKNLSSLAAALAHGAFWNAVDLTPVAFENFVRLERATRESEA